MKPTHFTVQGSGPFPVDMLRYDGAYPRDPESAARLLTPVDRESRRDTREVHLNLAAPSFLKPTHGRWSSFGWAVVAVYDQHGNIVR